MGSFHETFSHNLLHPTSIGFRHLNQSTFHYDWQPTAEIQAVRKVASAADPESLALLIIQLFMSTDTG